MVQTRAAKLLVTEELAMNRWRFLDDLDEPVCILTRKMEVVFLNMACCGVVPPDWFGNRCWDAFPVENKSCALTCPAVKALAKGGDVPYFEELLQVAEAPLRLGVAVIPFGGFGRGFEEALVVLRVKDPLADRAAFQAVLELRAREIFATCKDRLPIVQTGVERPS